MKAAATVISTIDTTNSGFSIQPAACITRIVVLSSKCVLAVERIFVDCKFGEIDVHVDTDDGGTLVIMDE